MVIKTKTINKKTKAINEGFNKSIQAVKNFAQTSNTQLINHLLDCVIDDNPNQLWMRLKLTVLDDNDCAQLKKALVGDYYEFSDYSCDNYYDALLAITLINSSSSIVDSLINTLSCFSADESMKTISSLSELLQATNKRAVKEAIESILWLNKDNNPELYKWFYNNFY